MVLQDLQEYVNLVCNEFLANVSLVIQSCYDMFIKRHLTRYSQSTVQHNCCSQRYTVCIPVSSCTSIDTAALNCVFCSVIN